mgnify:CR=1 FL=1
MEKDLGVKVKALNVDGGASQNNFLFLNNSLQLTSSLREIFKKKLFLANHLYQAQQKMKAAVEEMDDE